MAKVTTGLNEGAGFSSGETVTPSKLNDLVNTATVEDVEPGDMTPPTRQALVPPGAVVAFAMQAPPDGWLQCSGGAVSRETYAALFAAVGTAFGEGDGSTTFNLPDLRGYFVRGFGTHGDGTASGAFGVAQADELRAHAHTVFTRINATGLGNGWAAASNAGASNGTNNATQNTGGAETRPKNVALCYCIKT